MRSNDFINEEIETWPDSIDELFHVAERNEQYYIVDEAMDNVEAMQCFLETIPDSNITLLDDTQVFLTHSKYDYLLQIDSYGGGDFTIHVFDLTKRPLDYLDIKEDNADVLSGGGFGKKDKHKHLNPPGTNYSKDRKKYNNGAKAGANDGFIG